MANTAFDHASALTIPGSTTNNGLVRWGDTSGTSFGNITGITSDGSNLTLLTRGEIRFSDADSTHFIAFESPATVSTSYTMTLPADLPAADEVLTVTSYSGGAGVLEWAAAGGSGAALTGSTNNTITTVTGADAIQGEAGLTYSGTAMLVALAGSPPTPDHVSMHIWEGSAGSVTASTDTQLIIEHSGNAGITILTPNSGTAQLSFGCPAENRQGSIFYDQSANMMTLRSGNDNLKRITLSGSSGDATIYSNLVIGTAGKGIDFSAATPDESGAGSMSSELLDDYEEGTWTPVLWDNSNDAGTQSYTSQDGKYTKIGNVVNYSFRLYMSSVGNLTTSQYAKVGGLPFAPSGAIHGGGASTYMYYLNLGGGVGPIMFMTEDTAPFLSMYQSTATNANPVTVAEISDDGLIQGVGHYVV